MDDAVIQLIVLGAVAVFLVMRLRNVLGTRTGFEPGPESTKPVSERAADAGLEVVESGPDLDVSDYADPSSTTGKALAKMKIEEPGFSVSDFVSGSKQAYEMIIVAYENDDLDTLKQFLSEEVYEGFEAAILDRQDKGESVEASFIGVSETKIEKASFNARSKMAEITMRFRGELTAVVRDAKGKVVRGEPDKVEKQVDVWTFARRMGSDDPNWDLVETGG